MSEISKEMKELLSNTEFFNGLPEILSLDFNKVLSLKNEKNMLEGDDMISYLLLYDVASDLKEMKDDIARNLIADNGEAKEKEVDMLFEQQKSTLAGIILSKRIDEVEIKNNKIGRIDRASGINLLIGAITCKRERNIEALNFSRYAYGIRSNETYLIKSREDARENLFRSLGEFLIEGTELGRILSEQGVQQCFDYEYYGYNQWASNYHSKLYLYDGDLFFMPKIS